MVKLFYNFANIAHILLLLNRWDKLWDTTKELVGSEERAIWGHSNKQIREKFIKEGRMSVYQRRQVRLKLYYNDTTVAYASVHVLSMSLCLYQQNNQEMSKRQFVGMDMVSMRNKIADRLTTPRI